MPYKDPERKKAWELQHRTQRLTRRRELRRLQEAAKTPQRSASDPVLGPIGPLWLPMLAGAGLAAYSPKLALGAGGLTLLAATYYRKGWQWWLVGALTVLLAFVFLLWERGPKSADKK